MSALVLTCCSLDGIHRKRCFLAGKSGYIYFPTGVKGEARWSTCRGKQAGGTNAVSVGVGTQGEERHTRQARNKGGGDTHGARRQGLEGSHLGLHSIISLDTYLDTPNADLKDTAGGWVKVHGEPSGGGDLHEGWVMLEAVTALPPDPCILPNSVG